MLSLFLCLSTTRDVKRLKMRIKSYEISISSASNQRVKCVRLQGDMA
ncbi:hypothetical protein HMPREF0971_00434 [Segatella oris F0302]|uniref:Uncharacterized protein n=1 Tax=Segatella oris F0302 TaxID=649760 RepID=D1QN98_9BACT|nr:hypothetical protein HMPREF0971_00434 [Segatella oris F0302]